MLTEICAEIKNYFSKDEDRVFGDFSISDGALSPDVGLLENQYFRIIGSVFNDGVHKNGDVLTDEPEFHGAVWKMRVPADVLTLAEDIAAWMEKNTAIDSENMSPFLSESFGGYSYAKGSTSSSTGQTGATAWQDVFIARLNRYRRISEI